MADIKISEMTPADPLTGAEIFPIVQENLNKIAGIQDIRALISATGDIAYDNSSGVLSVTTYKSTDFDTDFGNKSTDSLSEGTSNLYFTDNRVQSVIDTNTAGFITDYTVTESDVTQHQSALSISESQISDLQNYITDYTVTESDVTQHQSALSISESQISDLQNYITDYTVTESDVTQHQSALSISESQISDLQNYLTTETNDLTSAVTWANVPDTNITQSSVTQHESALSITESQISDLSSGDPTKGTLTKSFSQDETASITLSEPVSVAPVVSAIREIPQVGILSKSNWDVASNGANYDRHDTAYSADLSVTSITVSDLESTTSDNTVWDASLDRGNDANGSSINFDGAFNDDGTKFYRLDDFNTLNQYTVSTAYDLSTTSYDNTAFDFNFEFAHGIESVAWSTDGTKLFGNDSGFGAVRQYSTPTAFDLSTVNDDSVSVSISGVGLEFDSAGSQFFVLDSPFVQSFSGFSAPFDISGATSGSSFDVTHPDDPNFSPFAFVFSSDGSQLYVTYQDEFNLDAVEIREIALSTQYDLTTAGFTGKTLDITSTLADGGNSGPTWMMLENSDTKLYVNENFDPDQIHQFTFGTDTTSEFSLSTGSFASSDVGKQIEGNGGVAVLLDTAGSFQEITAFNDTSTIPAGEWGMFALKFDSENGVTLTGTSETQSISNAAYDNASLNFNNDTNVPGQGFVFNEDGTVVYIRTQYDIYSYDLAQPYDLSSAGSSNLVQTTFLSDPSESAMEFGDAGSKFYIGEGSTLYQYSLGTAYDLSAGSVDLASQSTEDATYFLGADIKSVKFNLDGTKIYFLKTNNEIEQYILTNPFDISTVPGSPDATYAFDNTDGIDAYGVDFSQDGTRLFVSGEDNNQFVYGVFEYTLATAFDISTLSYSGNSFVDTNFNNSNDPKIRLEDNDTRLYWLIRNDSLYQYSSNLFSFIQPVNQYSPAVTNVGGQIDTTTWLDINAMTPDELPQAGEVYYAVSTDGRTEWRVIDNTDGERIIARLNAGTWEYNSATTYTTDTFTEATTNQELYALREALEIAANRMDKAQLEAVTDPNHYALNNSLDLMIALYETTGALDTPSSDGVAIDYDAETLNQGAVLGTDYDWDFPDSTTVRITSNAAQNLKIRIL